MSTLDIPFSCLAIAIGLLPAIPMATAATINQSANASASTGWNTASQWTGSAAPTSGNDYATVAGTGSTLIYTLNGTAWNQASWSLRDVVDASNTMSTTFGGDHLTLSSNTVLNGRATGGSTQTANIVFNGGFYRGNVGTAGTTRSTNLAGTIAFSTASTVGAIGTFSPNDSNSFTLNVNSTITGGANNLLQLTMNGGALRTAFLNLNGNLSGFFGTIYAGVSTAGVNLGIANTSRFSITSNATFATVQLDTTTTNFGYSMGTDNVTFGALRYGSGSGTAVSPGVYTAAALNTLTGGTYFFGTGTITVVPEPGVTAIGAIGLLGALVLFRTRQFRKAS